MEQKDYRLAAIMYTDIAGFSRMMEKDEAGTLELLAYHNQLFADIVGHHHGTIIKTIGDALLIDFKNTVEALQSAMEVQDKLYEHNKQNPGLPLLVRIGVHLGDIYFFENDALGEGINISARLQSLARPGCICFSQDVYNLVLNKIEFRAEKLGKVSLKNITKEIHAYEITTPNVEFDPNRDKPRSGYQPGSYLEGGEELPVGGVASSTGPFSSREASPPAAAPEPPAASAAPTPPSAPERAYTEEASRSLLTEIRKAILEDIKTMGRRMTVDEALSRYSFYGVEAREVIATMVDQGILVKRGGRDQAANAREQAASAQDIGSVIAGFGRNASGEFDSSALKNNIEAAVSGIVDQIERSVEGHMSSDDRDKYRDRMERYRDKAERHAERYREHEERHREKDEYHREKDERHRERDGRRRTEVLDFAAYRRRLEEKSRRARGGLIGNLTSYLAVNGFLWFINLSTSASFLWASIVSAAWGIGLVSSIVGARRANESLRAADALPDLELEQIAEFKKINSSKNSLAQHGATTVMICFFLGLINFLTGPHFLWFLIPTAALVLGYLAHAAGYAASTPRLERSFLAGLGIKGGWKNIFTQGKARKAATAEMGPYVDLYREAESTKAGIVAQLASGAADKAPVDSDLLPALDQYLGQVKLLAVSANEIDRLVSGIPMVDLSKDKAALVAKRDGAATESLKAEYGKSIEEIEKQERSYQELKEQSEVVKLRLGSSVNQLKQMRLDIARLQAAPGAEGTAGLEGLRRRTDELSHYLEDLRTGYSESGYGKGEDPFAQLEAEEKRRLEAEAKAKGEIEGPKV